nr:hypothetical protein BaRGS_008054 [Batillaria attramentaria]
MIREDPEKFKTSRRSQRKRDPSVPWGVPVTSVFRRGLAQSRRARGHGMTKAEACRLYRERIKTDPVRERIKHDPLRYANYKRKMSMRKKRQKLEPNMTSRLFAVEQYLYGEKRYRRRYWQKVKADPVKYERVKELARLRMRRYLQRKRLARAQRVQEDTQ